MDIAAWLRGLSLERYGEAFHDNAIELEILTRNPWDVFIQPDEEPFEDPSAASGRSTPTPTWPLFFGMISQGRPEPGRDILHGRRTRFPHARKLLAGPEVTIKEIAASLKVNRATIYRAFGLGAARQSRVGKVSPR